MGVAPNLLMHTFGRHRGVLGRLGCHIMARTNEKCAAWVVALLDIQPNDKALEVGFGPGVGIQLLVRSASAGYIAEVDSSVEMVKQAAARNAKAIESRLVDLRYGSVERLPFEDNTFDTAMTIHAMQVWPNAATGLREMQRVLKAGGKIALGFTPYSGRSKNGVAETFMTSGLVEARVVESDTGFCAMAHKP